ncbi:MAG: serine/threonine protein kinase, partial [Nannocystis sp.]|nr:serine/threonine protein kinase [Nannocystis sp.]
MGVVYAAYDEELERKLAIKLLLPGKHSDRQSLGEARLLREAQALARVSHPNVVQVYEVGAVGDAVYIAMELVRGKSLGEWLGAGPRSWRDILGVFKQVAAGLVAAHAAGVVHRDIKPDNLLVGDDGRVRVLDFSLARAPAPDPSEESSADLGHTRAGALIGTPLYMSPEQLRGEPADARSDQFGFCVTMYEALHGVRPFTGATLGELRTSVFRGEVRSPTSRGLLRSLRLGDSLSRRTDLNASRPAAVPTDMTEETYTSAPPGADTGAPAWLRRALLRGLRTDPAQRYPDMNALLAELGRDPYRF